MRLLFNILAILGSAMFAGVLLAIGVILGGYWTSLQPADFLDWFSQNGQFIMRAIPLVLIPTLIGLAGALWLSWGERKARMLWLGSIVCIATVLILTVTWFLPNNAQFSGKAIPLDQVSAKLHLWLQIHNLRIALAAIASVLGVIAITRKS